MLSNIDETVAARFSATIATLRRTDVRAALLECGVVSGVINLESSSVEAPDWRPRHDEHYHEA
jgi:hypothetical protein